MNKDRVAALTVGGEQRSSRNRVRLLHASAISMDWGSTTSVVQWCDVISARSVGNCTEVATPGGTVKARCPLKEVIEVLSVLGLVQLRRDLAVNASYVRRLTGYGRHRLIVELEDSRCVHVGRQFQRDVRALFGRQSSDRARGEIRASLQMARLKKNASGG